MIVMWDHIVARQKATGRMDPMTEVHHGLEGVVAFETQIAEPDKEGSALRYRGVDIEDIVGRVPFEKVWGLLIDGKYEPGLPPAEPYNLPIHTGDVRADVQAGVAMLAPMLGMKQTYDISDEQARLDLSRIAALGIIFYLIMDIAVHWGVLRHLRKEVDANPVIPVVAIALDLIILGGFLWVKIASDPLVLIVATAVMAAILIAEFFFLRTRPSEDQPDHEHSG